MQTMITDADDFFTKGCGRCARFDTPDCSTRQWIDGLNNLRRICRDMGLEETVKWAHPTYMHAGRNIAIFGAFRGDFRLSFMNASLLNDTEGVLEPQGPNSRTPGVMPWTTMADSRIAVTTSPGMPRASVGIMALPVTALFADSAAISPSGSPLPKFSRRGEACLAEA